LGFFEHLAFFFLLRFLLFGGYFLTCDALLPKTESPWIVLIPPAALDAVALSSLREGEGGIEVITHHGFGDFGNCAAIEY
jgi:hypothetical protein